MSKVLASYLVRITMRANGELPEAAEELMVPKPPRNRDIERIIGEALEENVDADWSVESERVDL